MPTDKGYVSGNDAGSDSGASTVEFNPPPPPPPPQTYIQFKVVDNNGCERHYRIKKDGRLAKLKTSYTATMGIPVNSVRFHFDGRPIGDDDTAEILGMEDGDTVEVYQKQEGGSGSV